MRVSVETFNHVLEKLQKIAAVLLPILYGMGFGLTARIAIVVAIGLGILFRATYLAA